jgi:hypothetical protein
MSQNQTTNEHGHPTTGVKLAHEMLVDLLGGLIPGVLYLFSIILSVAIPIFLYTDISLINKEKSTNVSGDWIWIVLFLTFLILAYVIGHIFYRSSIKKPDKIDLIRHQKTFYKKLSKKLNKIKKTQGEDIQSKKINKIKKLLLSEIKPLKEAMKSEINSPKWEKEHDVYNKDFFTACENIIGVLTDEKKDINNIISRENRENFYKILFPESKKEFVLTDEYYTDIINSYKKKAKRILKRGKVRLYNDESLLELTIYYCILHFQNELGCATEDRCEYPYISYYKYLLKRGDTNLLYLVNWCTNENRSKNKINDYKIKLQMYAANIYAILNKTESHIRMASSSWYAARAMRWIVWPMMILTAVPFVANVILYGNIHWCFTISDKWNDFLTEATWGKDMLTLLIAFGLPLSTFLLLRALDRKVTYFIHYQRMREVFQTLSVYHNWRVNEDRLEKEKEARERKCPLDKD